MLASDSEDEKTAINESSGYILTNERPNITNLLEVEQSRIYRSFLKDKDQFKLPNSKNQQNIKQHNVKQQFVKQRSNEFKDAIVNKQSTINQQMNKSSKFDKTDDFSSFNCEIPSELYSIVEGRQVFRLFNHIEHVKDNDSFNSRYQNNQKNSNESSYKSINELANYSTIDSIRSASKENFRVNTLPDESRFCNFLNQTKFDTLIEDDENLDLKIDENGEDEFKTLTESNDQMILNNLKNNLNDLDNFSNYDFKADLTKELNENLIKHSKNGSSNKFNYSIHSKDKPEFDNLQSENNCLREIINYFDENKRLDTSNEDNKINQLSKIDEISRGFSDYKSIDNSKESNIQNSKDISTRSNNLTGSTNKSSIKLNVNLSRYQSTNNQTKSVLSLNVTKPRSNYDSSTSNKNNEESLDVFRDFSNNMAKLNETEPSYLKNLEPINETKKFTNLDDELSMSMNFSPIKPTNNVKSNFFKTPLRMPLARSTNQHTEQRFIREEPNQSKLNQPVNQTNKEEFLAKDKLQSTFVDNRISDGTINSLRRSRLNEEKIRQNVENELQKLRLRNEQSMMNSKEQRSSNLTKLMEQTQLGLVNQSIEKSSRTSDILEKTRTKIEEFKRQQLEKSKLNEDRTNYESNLSNVFGKESRSKLNDQSNQLISNKQITNSNYSKSSYLEQPHKTVIIDQSEIDNNKFRLIEEQLRQAELSKSKSSINKRFSSTQSLQNLKDKSCSPINETIKNRSTKSASSISRPEDILSFEDSSDQTLVGSSSYSTTINQNLTLHNSNLEEQKTYLKSLSTQLIKIKDLENKSKLIKKRVNEKKVNHQQTEKPLSSTKLPEIKSTSPTASSTGSSLNTLSLNTISPSSIDLSEQNLDSILESSEELNSIEDDKRNFSENVLQNNNLPIGEESSFHCKCCQRNKLKNDVETQTSTVLPVNNQLNKLNKKEIEQYDEFSKRLERIKSNMDQLNLPQINRKQTFNKIDLLIDRQLNGTFSKQRSDQQKLDSKKEDKQFNEKRSLMQTSIEEDELNEDLESSFNLNNQSLDETFKSKCPQLYNKIQHRRNMIQKKMQRRKELEMMKKTDDEKQLRKNLKSKQLKSNVLNKSPRKVGQK